MTLPKIRYYRYTNWHLLIDACRMGWLIEHPTTPSHHDYWGSQVVWICDCPIPWFPKDKT